MTIFPAIDILRGRAVRLTRGDYGSEKTYGRDAAAVASAFLDRGASHLHVVDLDGARDGAPANFETIRRIAVLPGLFIQVGGGIRSLDKIESYLGLGVGRVILGTAAVRDQALLRKAAAEYGERIAVGVDARDGRAALSGWLEQTDIDGVAFCRQLRDMGISTVIYTDISRDGALGGANLAVYETLSGIPGLNVIASGGISSLPEIEKLARMGLYGAIVGKALYEGLVDLPAALKAAKGGGVPC
ncbi:MAG TPA: 1-(5-phosphoribosyl)-5-[(5-phosphoribosylamino)methylideneamino]imidazole-4-carboxamide isomerase [Clostridiales bacterium]|nr:1-(5-phosphoribosyl)-5-[(5-phosphoribosylamino)methylideneamino]imidazole-4-carboxamide isomerase [Clostridiales bacterium]